MNTRFTLLAFIFSVCALNVAFSQNFTLSGYVKDARSGETLIGVNVFNKDNKQQGAATNTYGFYSLTLPKGTYTIKASYVGFQDKETTVDLTADQPLNFTAGSCWPAPRPAPARPTGVQRGAC